MRNVPKNYRDENYADPLPREYCLVCQDRSGWFGASDTARIMGKWDTPSFSKWWLVKMGLRKENFTSAAMRTGTALEHRILDHLNITERDRRICLPHLRLRVNLDGETAREISEVKTYSANIFRVSKAYWQQCQVEMFASGFMRRRKTCRIVAYRVLPEDYENWFLPIEENRISYHPIVYDPAWIKASYLPRLYILKDCLRKGVWPHESDL